MRGEETKSPRQDRRRIPDPGTLTLADRPSKPWSTTDSYWKECSGSGAWETTEPPPVAPRRAARTEYTVRTVHGSNIDFEALRIQGVQSARGRGRIGKLLFFTGPSLAQVAHVPLGSAQYSSAPLDRFLSHVATDFKQLVASQANVFPGQRPGGPSQDKQS